MAEDLDAVMESASVEIEALRRDTRVLRKELDQLQRTNSRLANLLFQQRESIRGLLGRLSPSSSPGQENQELEVLEVPERTLDRAA